MSFVPDLLSGQLAMSVSPLNVVLQMVRDGQLVALANSGERRSTLLPDVPTMIESGYPDATSVSWFGLHAPAGTPAPVVARLAAATLAAANDPVVRERLIRVGVETAPLDTAAFGKFLDVETGRAERYVATLDTSSR